MSESIVSQWDCYACGRAHRMTHPRSADSATLLALARQQHTARQRIGRGRRFNCAFDGANIRIVRDTGTSLVPHLDDSWPVRP